VSLPADHLITAADAGPLVSAGHQPGLTLLALVVAVALSLLALQTALLARSAPGRRYRQLATGTGAIALGGGVWTVHFIAMLAHELPAPVHYRSDLSLLSLLPSLLASWLALTMLSRHRVSCWQILVSGLLIGLGICAMHYLGMAALVTPLALHYDRSWLVLSMIIAMTLASLALWLRFGGGPIRLPRPLRPALSAVIMALAILGMHYAGMAAARFHGEPGVANPGLWLDKTTLALVLASFSLTASAMVVAANGLIRSRLLYRRLKHHHLRLQQARQSEQLARTKNRFLTKVSHEVRTPMNAILTLTELLLQGPVNATQRSQLATIRDASHNLLGLVNGILDTTRIESGWLQLEHRRFSLRRLAEQLRSTLEPAALQRQLRLTLHYAAGLPEYFLGDPLRLRQVLTNLVDNAIKFTEQGEVTIRLSSQEGWVQIEVQDTGIGMTDDQLRTVFEPFAQADASIGRRFGGTGLGTTIARQLVEAMGGCIEASSQLGQGSCFRVRLPLAPASGETEPAQPLLRDASERALPGSELHQGLRRLQELLAGHELDDELTTQVCTGLRQLDRAADTQALQRAIHHFDFQRACDLLNRVQSELAPGAGPLPPPTPPARSSHETDPRSEEAAHHFAGG